MKPQTTANAWMPTESEDGETEDESESESEDSEAEDESEDTTELLGKALETINKQADVISNMLAMMTKKR
jgi:hypothetical protein